MSSHRRVKDIAYDEDELYSDEDDFNDANDEYTAEDKQNFAALTPVVRAHLQEAGLQASDRQIEEALWHYYWDVGKSVDYITSQQAGGKPKQTQKQQKSKSKFDEALEKSSSTPKGLSLPPGPEWFAGISWAHTDHDTVGELLPPPLKKPKLLGGSSKLAKLAEERRRKAEAAKTVQQSSSAEIQLQPALSALDKLALDRTGDIEPEQLIQSAPRKYPARKKRETTPPPPFVEDVIQEEPAKLELPDIRAQPSTFGAILSHSTSRSTSNQVTLEELIGTSKPPPVVTPQTTASVEPSKPRTETLPDAVKLWEQSRKTQRPFAAFVVAGHVDHGKSTLMGRLLLDTGAVQQRDIDKFRKQAAEIGKESFALAWVMDTGAEERERGVTVDIAQHFFSTEHADFTILDAPGHRDFIPNMIGGAMMADIVVLVVDANQLESGLKGQTREHILLAHGVGIQRVIVAVNKLDASNPPWNQELFVSVKDQISSLLSEIGFKQENIRYVPCSGLSGENVVKKAAASSAAAVQICANSPSLVEALQSLAYNDNARRNDPTSRTPQEVAIKDAPFRLQVADVFRGGVQNPLSVSGRIFGGSVVVGQKIVIQPGADQAVVKGLQVASEPTEFAAAFEIASLHLDGDMETLSRNLRVGDMLTSTTKQISLVKAVSVRIEVLETIFPQTAEVHYGRLHIAASVRRLVAIFGANGETLKKNPKTLKKGQHALVEVAFTTSVPLEIGNRIVLRADGSTIAFGVIEGLFSS